MRIEKNRLGILLIFAVIACLLARTAFVTWRQTANDQATEHVSKVGGEVLCDDYPGYVLKVGNQTISWCAGSPPRLHQFLRWTYFRTPAVLCLVNLSKCELTIEDCRTVSAVHNCAILALRDASIPSDGLAYLVKIPTLEFVDLRGITISSDIFEILKRNHGLRAVGVTSRLVDFESMAEFIRDMPNCEVIRE